MIPLILGARPVSIRPYRVAPELKDETECQVQDLCARGVIVHSDSTFSSPVLLVKKTDVTVDDVGDSLPVQTWRFVADYRHLNALTVKSKYPLQVIDEILHELSRSKWFSKLELKAEYHQIRLAPGEEHKTAFQTHDGNYDFKVCLD